MSIVRTDTKKNIKKSRAQTNIKMTRKSNRKNAFQYEWPYQQYFLMCLHIQEDRGNVTVRFFFVAGIYKRRGHKEKDTCHTFI